MISADSVDMSNLGNAHFVSPRFAWRHAKVHQDNDEVVEQGAQTQAVSGTRRTNSGRQWNKAHKLRPSVASTATT